jgi:hypothetical protein
VQDHGVGGTAGAALGAVGSTFMLASGVVGTIAWCGVLTYAALALIW